MKRLQSWVYGTVGIVLLNASTGCVNISYTALSGETLTYKRWLGQKITGLRIVKDDKGLISFEFDTQEAEVGKIFSDLTETVKNFSETLKTR